MLGGSNNAGSVERVNDDANWTRPDAIFVCWFVWAEACARCLGSNLLQRRTVPAPVTPAACGSTESAAGYVAGLWAGCLTYADAQSGRWLCALKKCLVTRHNSIFFAFPHRYENGCNLLRSVLESLQ